MHCGRSSRAPSHLPWASGRGYVFAHVPFLTGTRGPVMASAASARIHPTAVVTAEAVLAENVEVGPHVVIEGRVVLGPDCVLRPRAILCGPLTMGRGNLVF